MKKSVLNLIKWTVPRLPLRLNRTILLELMCIEGVWDNSRIGGFITEGKYGAIQGSLYDTTIFREYLRVGTWAENTNNLISNFLCGGGLYLDIGGNIGLTTIPVSKNAKIECHTFEPEPLNFQYLKSNVAVNCSNNNVKIYNLALFDRATTMQLEISPSNFGDHRIRTKEDDGSFREAGRRTINVRAVRLDDLDISICEPMAVKIDTQGAEPFIISGGSETLARAGLFVLEFWPYGMARMGGDPQIIMRFLSENFSHGMVSRNDDESLSDWQPIETVILQLKAFSESEPGISHLDVYAKKDA